MPAPEVDLAGMEARFPKGRPGSVAVRELIAALRASRERVAVLEGALRPFATRVEQWYSDIREGGSRVPEGPELATFPAEFTMADCEQARAALSPEGA